MHLEGDRGNVFEYKMHSDANFNSRAVHLFGALESFCGDFSNRSCVCPGDLQITEQMVDIKRAGTIFSHNYDPVSTKQWCFCTVICEARPPTCYSCAFGHEIWTKPFGGIEDLSTADVKLLFEKWSEGRNFEDFVTLFSWVIERGRESKESSGHNQESSCLLVSVQRPDIWHFGGEPMQSDRKSGQRWWEPSPTGTGAVPCHTHTHGDAVKQTNTRSLSLSHRSIRSTEAGDQKRRAQGLLLWTDVSIRAELTGANTKTSRPDIAQQKSAHCSGCFENQHLSWWDPSFIRHRWFISRPFSSIS